MFRNKSHTSTAEILGTQFDIIINYQNRIKSETRIDTRQLRCYRDQVYLRRRTPNLPQPFDNDITRMEVTIFRLSDAWWTVIL